MQALYCSCMTLSMLLSYVPPVPLPHSPNHSHNTSQTERHHACYCYLATRGSHTTVHCLALGGHTRNWGAGSVPTWKLHTQPSTADSAKSPAINTYTGRHYVAHCSVPSHNGRGGKQHLTQQQHHPLHLLTKLTAGVIIKKREGAHALVVSLGGCQQYKQRRCAQVKVWLQQLPGRFSTLLHTCDEGAEAR